MSKAITVYMRLTDELVEVYRPVDAERLDGNRYRILSQSYDPSIETWEFAPGEIVECEQRKLTDGSALVAVRRVL